MFVALGIDNAKCKHNIVMYDPARIYDSFLHYLIKGTIFGKKRLLNIRSMCVVKLRVVGSNIKGTIFGKNRLLNIRSMCVVKLRVVGSNIKILSVA